MSAQLQEIHNSSGDTHELAVQAKNQADTSKAQVEILKAQIEVMKSEQLPWVGVREIIPMADVKANVDFSVGAIVENSGKSPAINEETWIYASRVLCGIPFPANPIPKHPANTPVVHIMLMPGGIHQSGAVKLHINQEIMENLSSGRCGLYVFGETTYCDIWNHAHYRHFCWQWQPGTQREFYACATFNDGDQDDPTAAPKVCRR